MARVGRPPRPGWEIDTTEWLAQCDQLRAANPPQRPHTNLVQTALIGEVQAYVEPDHAAGESFPGPQPSTTQLSLFESGFKRKSGQMSLFETGFKRVRV